MKKTNKITTLFIAIAFVLLAGILATAFVAPAQSVGVAEADTTYNLNVIGPYGYGTTYEYTTQYCSISYNAGATKLDLTELKNRFNNSEESYIQHNFKFLGLTATQVSYITETSYWSSSATKTGRCYNFQYSDLFCDADGNLIPNVWYVDATGKLQPQSTSYQVYCVFEVQDCDGPSISGLSSSNYRVDIVYTSETSYNNVKMGYDWYYRYYVFADYKYALANLSIKAGNKEIDASECAFGLYGMSTFDMGSGYCHIIYIPFDLVTGKLSVSATLEEKGYDFNVVNNDYGGLSLYGTTTKGNEYLIANSTITASSEGDDCYFEDLCFYDRPLYYDIRYRDYSSKDFAGCDYTLTFGKDLNGDGKINTDNEICHLDNICFSYSEGSVTISGGIEFLQNKDNIFDYYDGGCNFTADYGLDISMDNFYISAPYGFTMAITETAILRLGDVQIDTDKDVLALLMISTIYAHVGDNYYNSAPITVMDIAAGIYDLDEPEPGVEWNLDECIVVGHMAVCEIKDNADCFKIYSGVMEIIMDYDDDDNPISYIFAYNKDNKYMLKCSSDGDFLAVSNYGHYITAYEVFGGQTVAYTGKEVPKFYEKEKGATLPTLEKTNYAFAGWFTDEACTKKITEIAPNTDTDITLYAKFTLTNIEFDQSNALTMAYDSAHAREISVSLADTSLTVLYQWFKDGKGGDCLLPGENKSTILVQDVNDSGVYYCRITYNGEDSPLVFWSKGISVEITESGVSDTKKIVYYAIYGAIGFVLLLALILLIVYLVKKSKKQLQPATATSDWDVLSKHDALLVNSVVQQLNDTMSNVMMLAAPKEQAAPQLTQSQQVIITPAPVAEETTEFVAQEPVITVEETPAVEEDDYPEDSLTLSETISISQEIKGKLEVSKKKICNYIAQKFGKDVTMNEHTDNYTRTGLPLADTIYTLKGIKNDGSIGKVCFAYLYELEGGNMFILVRTNANHALDIKGEHNMIKRSRFPRNGEWYSIIIDDSFETEEQVFDILDRAKDIAENK